MAFTHEHSWTIEAPPERVFHALTDPDELRVWFAEDVQIEPAARGVYRFWGRHTLGTPPQEDARQVIERIEPNRALAYAWPIHEVDTTVSIALTPHEQGTTLSLKHEVSGDLPVPRQRELIDDHWRMAIGNLMAHLAGDAPSLPDHFATKPEVRIVTQIDAPPAAVFRALIEPERIVKWFFTKSATVEPTAGGRYDLGWTTKVNGETVPTGPRRILEIEQDRKLVLDWPDWRGDTSVADQTITFLLEPDGKGGTTLTFTHAGFERPMDISDYAFGWPGFLEMLAQEAVR